MKTVLLTGGRAPAALELARVFHSAGHRVLMAESINNHLSQPSRAINMNFNVPPPRQQTAAYLEALKQIVMDHHVDLLIPTCEEIFYVAMGREALSPYCVVFVEDIEYLRQLHHKALFIDKAITCGLSVPETMLIESLDQLYDAFGRWDALVLKPVYSRFASRTIIKPRITDIDNLAISANSAWVAQQFIEGKQLCTYSIAHNGRLTSHTAYRSEFTAGQGAAIRFQHIEHEVSLDWIQRFVAADQFTGQIAIDFIETASGEVFAIECNPRTISGAHLLAQCSDFANAFFEPSIPCVMPPPNFSAMLLTGMIIYGLPDALVHGKLRKWLNAFASSNDVIFRASDPMPALLQWRSILHFIRRGYINTISPLEASTFDIEWNGEHILEHH